MRAKLAAGGVDMRSGGILLAEFRYRCFLGKPYLPIGKGSFALFFSSAAVGWTGQGGPCMIWANHREVCVSRRATIWANRRGIRVSRKNHDLSQSSDWFRIPSRAIVWAYHREVRVSRSTVIWANHRTVEVVRAAQRRMHRAIIVSESATY